jgi:hypothetical protein
MERMRGGRGLDGENESEKERWEKRDDTATLHMPNLVTLQILQRRIAKPYFHIYQLPGPHKIVGLALG